MEDLEKVREEIGETLLYLAGRPFSSESSCPLFDDGLISVPRLPLFLRDSRAEVVTLYSSDTVIGYSEDGTQCPYFPL
jgi:hypothetical protein